MSSVYYRTSGDGKFSFAASNGAQPVYCGFEIDEAGTSKFEWSEFSTCGCMPCAFMVDDYAIRYNGMVLIQEKEYPWMPAAQFDLITRINLDYYKKIKYGLQARNLPWKDYLEHKTRTVITHPVGIYYDDIVKAYKWMKYAPALQELLPIMKECDPTGFFRTYVQNIHLTYGEHTHKYVAQHETAHPVRGRSWGEVLAEGDMYELYKFTREFVHDWKKDFDLPGDWCIEPQFVNIGSRGRSVTSALAPEQTINVGRVRRVGFCPGPSSPAAFETHEDQKHRIRRVFDQFEKLIGCKIYSPKTEGGIVYGIIQDALRSGKKVRHYDVAGMELITPTILSGSISQRPFGVGVITFRNQETPELMSGVMPTSDADMIAHLSLIYSLVVKRPEAIIILGDDATIIGGELRESILYEAQADDDLINWSLGLAITPTSMMPVGANTTTDSAEKRIAFKADREFHIVHQKLTDAERSTIADLFLGITPSGPLDEVIRKVPEMGGYYSPTEWVLKTLAAAT